MLPSTFPAVLPSFYVGWPGNNVVSNPSSSYERKSHIDGEVGPALFSHTINLTSMLLGG